MRVCILAFVGVLILILTGTSGSRITNSTNIHINANMMIRTRKNISIIMCYS